MANRQLPSIDIAQICLNGHVVNRATLLVPEHSSNHCEKCGSETITQCRNCQNSIRGTSTEVISGRYDRPAYCHNCGKPYPWTKAYQEAAIEMAQLLDSPELEDLFTNEMEHLSSETPKTQVVALKFKKYAQQAGVTVIDTFRGILIEVLAEAAKRAIYPNKP